MAAPELHWHIERLDTQGHLALSGWCFGAKMNPTGIIVRFHGGQTRATLSVPREDVQACHGVESTPLICGFSAKVDLPPGRHALEILAEVPGGGTITLEQRTVRITPAKLAANIESPREMQTTQGMVHFSGWCVHPFVQIDELHIRIGRITTACQYGIHRADVLAAMGELPCGSACGFDTCMPVAKGKWKVRLIATLADGTKAELDWHERLRIAGSSRTGLFRRCTRMAELAHFFVRQGTTWIRENRRLPPLRDWPAMIRFANTRFRATHLAQSRGQAPDGFSLPKPCDRYQLWRQHNRPNARVRAQLAARIEAIVPPPLLSLVMPVYNPSLVHLRTALESIARQSYRNWELCIADDASTSEGVHETLQAIARTDPRVKLVMRPVNGNISHSTNSAAALARGEFLLLMDQDDTLDEDALAHVALSLAEHPEADIIYSDDDKIDESGRHYAPQFKPEWSPTLLLGFMYFSHLFCIRRSLYESLGGMRAGYEGSQDHDLALRASEHARRIVHIPRVLYHWRAAEGSTAQSADTKPGSFNAARNAIQNALSRRDIKADVQQPDWARKAKVGIFTCRFPDDGPKISIIIPTRDELSVLRRCIDSLAKTRYRNYEVLIVDNESSDKSTLEYLAALPHRVVRITNPAGRFNYSWINNRAAEMASGEYLLFLNNDTEVVSEHWLGQMMGLARMEGVGAVGARLLFPDKHVQHAGIVHGYYGGLAGPAFKLLPEWSGGYLSLSKVSRDCSAVTAACMLTSRQLFLSSGGFDENDFEVAYNDVDYCYRIADRGLRSVYCADAVLFHHEGHSRGFVDRPKEIARFRRKYHGRGDAYYNPNLSLDDESFAIHPRCLPLGTSQPVRALMCAFNLNLEGAPFSQYELAVGMRDRGYVDPVIYSPTDGPLRELYQEAGIAVRIGNHPLRDVFDEPAYERAIARFGDFIADTGAEVVYGNTLQTFYAIDAAREREIPSLWNPRESEPWQSYFNFLPNRLAVRALQCFAYPYRVIFVAHATRKVWEQLESQANFAVIHNGLKRDRIEQSKAALTRSQARRSLGLTEDDLAVVLAGTVCERKGQLDLAHAISRLEQGSASLGQYFVVGDRKSDYSRQLHQARAAMPQALAQRLHIIPETPDIHRYYRAADVALCTSRVESFPRVILEAMAFGLPVISTDVFGIKEQVSHGVNALLYTPGDVAKLAEHLASLAGSDDLRHKLASNALPMLDTLNSYDQMIAAYGEFFREAAVSSPATLPGAT